MSTDTYELQGSTKKEKLLYLFKTCREPHITLAIVSPDMEHCEHVTVFRADYEYKANAISRDYDDDLKLYRNQNVRIDSVLGTVFLEETVYIY